MDIIQYQKCVFNIIFMYNPAPAIAVADPLVKKTAFKYIAMSYTASSYRATASGFNVLSTRFLHLLDPFYIMSFTECKNYFWKVFYGSFNFRQIGLRNYFFFFLPTFQFPRFLIMFPCSDLFENLYAYSLDHYLDNFSLVFRILDLIVEFHPFTIQNT